MLVEKIILEEHREKVIQWYTQDLLTDTEIANRLGVSQPLVSKWRRVWGITTITVGERRGLRLPKLTSRQNQILVGSLMGDGWMVSPGPTTARFNETHGDAQKEYLEWKLKELNPFVSNFYPTCKTKGGKVYTGWGGTTIACPQFRPFYDDFYPAPKRIRVFPADLHERITPLALAVWYLDDGSLASEGRNVRFSFGLGDTSLHRCLKALQALGLKPKHYGEGGDVGIWIMGQTHKFLELVEAHIPDCMAYKIPAETPRQKVDRNARQLTPEIAEKLYFGGLSSQSIGEVYGVGASTVSRRLKEAGVVKRKSGPQKKMSPEAASEFLKARYPDTSEWSTLPEKDQQEWFNDIYEVLRKVPFPYPQSVADPQKEFTKLKTVDLTVTDSLVIPTRSPAGLKLCYPLFPNRYKAQSGKAISAWEGWHDEKHLKRAIRWQLRVGDPVIPHRVLRAVTANCRTPTIFKPSVARFIYEQFCPPGGTTWDPCAGYGGRLLGALAAGVGYTGTDVELETVEGNRELAELLGCGDQVQVIEAKAQEFCPSAPVDLVFTSPPYFDQERYSEGAGQSWVEFSTLGEWVEGFLRPVVQRSWEALKSGGKLVLNVADVKGHALVESTIKVAAEVGFTLVEEWRMPLMALNRKDPWEPVLVFKKG